MELLKKEEVFNKTVLLRVDYNVPISSNGEILDNSRIVKSLETIKFLRNSNSKIIIISHFGRIKEESDKLKYSLEVVAKELCNLLGEKIVFIKETDQECVKTLIKDVKENIIVLENTRFYDLINKQESNCDANLSAFYGSLADIYINDAFGASHRKHSSTYGVTKHLPSYYGFLIDRELKNLNQLISVEKRPFTVFMGGAKVEDKLPVIKQLITKVDYLCLGGGILNSFLLASGYDIGDSLATKDADILTSIKGLLRSYPDKIILANDFIWNDKKITDINVLPYKEVILKSNLLFINGTPGIFENILYRKGTEELFNYVLNSSAYTILGGGDTASAVKILGIEDNIGFISSGGGASLEYIANKKLEALEN